MNYDDWKLMTPEEANPEGGHYFRDTSRDEYNHEDKIERLEREDN